GYPVLEHFRGKADAPPIIMITANEGSRHKAYAEYLGVVDYIRKPFAMERLLEAVNKAFTRPDPTVADGEQDRRIRVDPPSGLEEHGHATRSRTRRSGPGRTSFEVEP